MLQNKFQRPSIKLDNPVVEVFRGLVETASMVRIVALQQLGAHHRRQR